MSKKTGNPNGRPPRWKDPEEIKLLIDEYFLTCTMGKRDTSVSGLCVHLETYRQQLWEYKNKDGFCDIIKNAYQRIELDLINKTRENKDKQVINLFLLKTCHGLNEKTVVENTNYNNGIRTEDLSKLSDEDLDDLERIQKKLKEDG